MKEVHRPTAQRWAVIFLLIAGTAALLGSRVEARIPAEPDGPVPARSDVDRVPGDPVADGLDQDSPILGAALTILADGTEPWEDRPLAVAGLGTLPGRAGQPDPGDDLGPEDGIVRSWDAVIYRASFSVREGTAENLVAEVLLSDHARWENSQLAALELAGCPEGASLLDGGRRLRCEVGQVSAPPAVTVALDLSARVSGDALQGDELTAELTVRSSNARPDPDPQNCPTPRTGGCDAEAPTVQVSAAPAAEIRKHFGALANQSHQGQAGRRLSWQLDLVLGADGDVRGSSNPVGAPWTLPDWWRMTRQGRAIELPVTLLGCRDQDSGAAWSCAQPGGPGTPVDVTIERLDAVASLPSGVSSSLPEVVGRLQLDLWISEADLRADGGDVIFQNCFGTAVGIPSRALWKPSDARGQPNLGGADEPTGNNCSYAVLPVPTAIPPTRPPVRTQPPPGPPRPRPTNTPVPRANVSKRYTPFTQGQAVTDGSEFAAEVRVDSIGAAPMPGVVACDKWDNSTHVLRDEGVAGVRLWRQVPGGQPELHPEPERVLVEYSAGHWGRQRPVQVSVGRAWYEQATSACDDAASDVRAGWVTADEVDFTNSRQGSIDADEVNMVRARFFDPVPQGTSVWIEVLMRAEQNPPGSWLMNYGAAYFGAGPQSGWRAGRCDGATGSRTRIACPEPAPNTRTVPGPLGDMLVHVGVPLWLEKRTEPFVPGGSPVVEAGQSIGFVLTARTRPRPADPPLPPFPPGAFAPGVTLSDTLPVGLSYVLDSTRLASEDLNANGRLDPGEDLNGNGRIDSDVPFEPAISAGPREGEVTLRWNLGDLPHEIDVPEIRYQATSSRLLRGGTALANMAGLHSAKDRAPNCRPGAREAEGGRCAWAQLIVANVAAAQVEKLPRLPLVLPGEPMVFQLALANLTSRPVEWFDAVDILPRAGEPRSPGTSLTGGITDLRAEVRPGGAPMQIWASDRDPEALDTLGGSPRDGLIDPVVAWGAAGAGLGGPDWPCQLSAVGTAGCTEISARDRVTALRFWGPDPDPARSGGSSYSFLPPDMPPRRIDLTLDVPGSQPEDRVHNAWGGRFDELPLPVFDDALIRVRFPDTPTPTPTSTPTDTPSPTVTPTASNTPTPSDTPTATGTPTVTPTPSNTPTATPTPIYTIYLPLIINLPCKPRTVDVVLVVDLSSSMLRPAGDGGSKLDAVLRAARAFIEDFDPGPGRGRIGLAAFNDEAWIVQPLTEDRARLDAAVATLADGIQEGTRLDLGLLVGKSALQSVEPGRVKAMVFLTDGLPNRVPTPEPGGRQEDTVLAAAEQVREAGILVHTVGYGRADAPDLVDRILPWLLEAIAGSPDAYHETDDAGALALVFRRIAIELGCVREIDWP